MQFTDVLASATAWGTLLDRQSRVLVLPIEGWYWEIDCNDADAATTEAAYQAFGGENCSFALYGGIAPTTNPQNRAHPRLDIGSHATTNTLALRINRVSDTQDNVDFTGNYVKMIVEINIGGPGGMPNSVVTSTGICSGRGVLTRRLRRPGRGPSHRADRGLRGTRGRPRRRWRCG